MLMNYDHEIQNSIKNNLLKYADIFDFRNTPSEDLFNNYYMFCRESLDINSAKYNINPNVFAFKNGFNSNAEAKRTVDNAFGIFVNLGLLGYCAENFQNNTTLDKYCEQNFPHLVEKFDIKPSALAFQITTQFSYYHELAHLIQFSKKAENFALQERNVDCNEYHEIRHILEINADTYASVSIVTHIVQYIDKCFGKNPEQKLVEDTILLLSSCLLNYITSFYDDLAKIYFKMYCHPHPVFRLFNVMMNIGYHVNEGIYAEHENINIDTKELTKRMLELYKNLEESKVFKTNLNEALDAAAGVKDEIVQYLGDLIEFKTTEYFNAMDKWNEHII